MAELVVVGFGNEHDADHVLIELGRLRREHLIDLEDAVVAVRDPDGKIHIKQSISVARDQASRGGLSGALWGTLIGLLFLNPLAGMAIGGAVGAGAGALSGKLVDYGIDDQFIRDIGKTLEPNSSALFLLIRKVQPDKVLNELSKYGGHVLRSSLSPEQESKLQSALSQLGRAESASEGSEAAREPAAAQ